MARGWQKSDHGGNFFMVPSKLLNSVAWRHASMRARVVFFAFADRFNGENNGQIAFPIKEIGRAIGDQNHGANGRAVAELIELGFLECVSDASRKLCKAREYRITCVSSGGAKSTMPATHEYLDWRPGAGKTRKFGGARTTTRTPVSVAVTTTDVKFSVADTATRSTESCGIEPHPRVAVTAPHILNHPTDNFRSSSQSEISHSITPTPRAAEPAGVPVDELREWMKATIASLPYGGQRTLATDAGIPEPAISRFKAGKHLPDQYHLALQHACGRALPYVRWKAEAA